MRTKISVIALLIILIGVPALLTQTLYPWDMSVEIGENPAFQPFAFEFDVADASHEEPAAQSRDVARSADNG